MAIAKNGKEILSLEDWETRAGPKSPGHWKDGRSAKEAARAWIAAAGSLPAEVNAVLLTHQAFSRISNWDAEPEARLQFDSFAGEPRNSDLVIYANDVHGPFVIAVEAKADESFGEPVARALAAAVERRLKNPRSNGVARIEQLAAALLGPRVGREPQLGDLRYQLLTATAGALCAAERIGAKRAVVLVHEFITAATSDDMHFSNAADLTLFVRRISHNAVLAVDPGHLYGPFVVPGEPLLSAGVQLFVAKAMRNLRGSGA